jgi:tRNA pseudouridine38-40 synthase
LPKLAAIVEYDGTDYSGWQSQPHARSIQQEVEAALSFVAGQPVQAVCAGRTDAGVHAAAQVIHFDTQASRTPRAWVLGANTRLPAAIALNWAAEVAGDFHARHRGERPEGPFRTGRHARTGLPDPRQARHR